MSHQENDDILDASFESELDNFCQRLQEEAQYKQTSPVRPVGRGCSRSLSSSLRKRAGSRKLKPNVSKQWLSSVKERLDALNQRMDQKSSSYRSPKATNCSQDIFNFKIGGSQGKTTSGGRDTSITTQSTATNGISGGQASNQK